MLQWSGSEQLKMDLASDTMWTLSGITLITYMHIWLVGFKANLHKANFSYLFVKTFLFVKNRYGIKTTLLYTIIQPSKF